MSAPITNTIPNEQKMLLMPDEDVFHFGYIDRQGGCAQGKTSAKQWIMITNQRVLYEASVREAQQNPPTYTRSSGTIPIHKIAYVNVSERPDAQGCGCSTQQVHHLRITSAGGAIELAIPTQAEARRIHSVIDALTATRSASNVQ